MPLQTVEALQQMGPVTIDRISATRVSIPMTEPFRISSGEVSCKDAIIVRLQNHIAFGWGESSAMPGAFYSHDTPDSCQQQLIEQALPRLVGQRFDTIGDLEAMLLESRLSPFVRVAIETAAWELLARERSQSLRALFGLPDKPIPTGLAVGLYPTLDQLHQALERYRARSYSRLKIKIKRGYDVELVQAVRRWYGDIPLFVDANCDYSRDDLEIFEKLDAYNLMMFEQPFPRGDLAASAELQSKVITPVCFDEEIESVADVHRAADASACRIVNIKLQRVGGFLEAARIAGACMERNIRCWMGTMPELGIGSAQAIVFASHPACVLPTDVEPSARWYTSDILQPELTMNDGLLTIPSGPGLGFVVDQDALNRHAVARWEF